MSKLRILSVDDQDFITQHTLVRGLRDCFEVELCSSIEDSFSLLRTKCFHALLLDHNLGPQFPNSSKFIPSYLQEFPFLFIVLVTHGDDDQKISEALALGASSYIVKSKSICRDVLSQMNLRFNRPFYDFLNSTSSLEKR